MKTGLADGLSKKKKKNKKKKKQKRMQIILLKGDKSGNFEEF